MEGEREREREREREGGRERERERGREGERGRGKEGERERGDHFTQMLSVCSDLTFEAVSWGFAFQKISSREKYWVGEA